jgi:uncharacterized protein (DUF2267 family)
MQYQEFVAQVQKQADLKSEDEAITVIHATLETLADHLAGNAPAKLAAQLPQGIGEFITNYKNDESADGEGFDVEEFVRRTAEKIGLDDSQSAQKQVKAVLVVLRQAISIGEFDKMRGTLPAEYDTLFDHSDLDILSISQSAS